MTKKKRLLVGYLNSTARREYKPLLGGTVDSLYSINVSPKERVIIKQALCIYENRLQSIIDYFSEIKSSDGVEIYETTIKTIEDVKNINLYIWSYSGGKGMEMNHDWNILWNIRTW